MSGADDNEGSVSFSSPEEEIEYWKEKAMEYRARYLASLASLGTDTVLV